MTAEKMTSYKNMFLSRMDTLSHILDLSMSHFKEEGDSILKYRIVEDMLPFGTQIAFTCNQPRNFTLWCEGQAMNNLPPEVNSLNHAKQNIKGTREDLVKVEMTDVTLQETRRIALSEGQYLELSGIEYLDDFLVPNLYFHLVTAYNIMRMKGVPLGKVNYMLHVASKVKS
ncbi:MAG: DUF1993 domain-containing protein [Pseudomonadales bacterium]|nr:DUF1993 domain-containing protein [Pseudomonadales bacterium]